MLTTKFSQFTLNAITIELNLLKSGKSETESYFNFDRNIKFYSHRLKNRLKKHELQK